MNKNKPIDLKPKLSVCIVSNVVNESLYQAVAAFDFPEFEICIGFNNINKVLMQAFQDKLPHVKCFYMTWEGYGPTKNNLADKATSDWILSIDDDEIADSALVANLRSIEWGMQDTLYRFTLKHKIGNHIINHGTFGAVEWKTRLYNKSRVRWDAEQVHEALIIPENSIYKNVNGILWHYTAENIAEMQSKNTVYAKLSAKNMFQKGKRANALKPLLAGAMAFVKQYFFKKGILDGSIGLQLAQESARYTFLKYKNLRALQKGG